MQKLGGNAEYYLNQQIGIKGIESNMGFASWIGQIAEKDAVLTKIFRDAGAVFYVKTNVPQTLVSWTFHF